MIAYCFQLNFHLFAVRIVRNLTNLEDERGYMTLTQISPDVLPDALDKCSSWRDRFGASTR